jgi:hypothetical protein
MMHPASWVSTGFPGMNLFSLNTCIHGLIVFLSNLSDLHLLTKCKSRGLSYSYRNDSSVEVSEYVSEFFGEIITIEIRLLN